VRNQGALVLEPVCTAMTTGGNTLPTRSHPLHADKNRFRESVFCCPNLHKNTFGKRVPAAHPADGNPVRSRTQMLGRAGIKGRERGRGGGEGIEGTNEGHTSGKNKRGKEEWQGGGLQERERGKDAPEHRPTPTSLGLWQCRSAASQPSSFQNRSVV
jgi:hypothetical protein